MKEEDCYCVCHSPVSSCPSCEHCKDIPLSEKLDKWSEDLKIQYDSKTTFGKPNK